MSWDTPLLFPDEDEAGLVASFVEFMARYPEREPGEIARYIFRNLRDPEMRSQQAAILWLKDLNILERIRLAKLNGGAEPNPLDSKEDKLRKLEAIYNNVEYSITSRLKAMELHAQIQGEIVKAVDKKVTDVRPRRQIIFAQAND